MGSAITLVCTNLVGQMPDAGTLRAKPKLPFLINAFRALPLREQGPLWLWGDEIDRMN